METHSDIILQELKDSIIKKNEASLVVSGGSSPLTIFKDLNDADIDWSKVNVTLVDDRFVSNNHHDSNEKLIYENLLINKASNANFISLCKSPDEVKKIQRPFDVMLLGIGEDGHFASLFPALISTHPSYFETNQAREIIYTDPMGSPCHKRVSMNLSMILESKKIILLISNEKKLKLIETASNDVNLPIYYLLNQKEQKVEIIKTF